jgi:hypothetical protein
MLCKSLNKLEGVPGDDQTAFRKERMSRPRVSEWKRPYSLRMETARQVRSKVKKMLIIFIDTKKLFTKN